MSSAGLLEERARHNGVLGPGVYLSTVPEMHGSYGCDNYGPVAFAVDDRFVDQLYSSNTIRKKQTIDEVWGAFGDVPEMGFAYVIFNDSPDLAPSSLNEIVPDRFLAVPLSEALVEREILRLAYFLTPADGEGSRWSAEVALKNGAARVLNGESDSERVPLSKKQKAYFSLRKFGWKVQQRMRWKSETGSWVYDHRVQNFHELRADRKSKERSLFHTLQVSAEDTYRKNTGVLRGGA
eukprot:g4542.t1